jgi:PGF-CTERM protein
MRTKLFSTFLVLALVTSGVALGAPTDAVQDDESTADVEFGDDVVRTENGGNATFTGLLNDADEAAVKIGSDDSVNYALVVTVTDGNEDRRVVLTFDTDAAGEPNVTKVTTDAAADDATVTDEIEYLGDESPKPPLDAGNYPVTLYSRTAADSDPVETATMVIEEAETTTESTETTTTTSEATTETAKESMTTTDVVTDPETTTDDVAGDVPGFGALLALVGLAATALLAARR